MKEYAIRRALLIIPTLFILSLAVFFFIRMIPGGIIDTMVQEHLFDLITNPSNPPSIEEITLQVKHSLGIDGPIYIQYYEWIKGIITRGDFGKSLWNNISLMEAMKQKLPVSIELNLISLIFGTIFSWPFGIYAAIRQDSFADHFIRVFSIISLALPGFWVATMVMIYPAIWWGWSPPIEYISLSQDFWGNIQQFLVPGIIGGLLGTGSGIRMARTLMLEVLRQDYIRTAWSKGLRENTVIIRHAIKNTMIPIVTSLAMLIPGMLGGSVIMEQIFSLPGMGRYLLEAIQRRDYLIISGYNLILATLVMVMILAADLSYAYLDPRIRYR